MSYKVGKDKHFLSLMKKAPDVLLKDYMVKFKQDRSDAVKKEIREAYGELGFALSNFHKKFMKDFSRDSILAPTAVQGDAHNRNIFYDPKTKAITFIDNERIAKYFFNREDPLNDIFFLVYVTIHEVSSNILQPSDLKEWFNVTLVPFIRGYAKAYEIPEQRNKVVQTIILRLKSHRYYPIYENDMAPALNVLEAEFKSLF